MSPFKRSLILIAVAALAVSLMACSKQGGEESGGDPVVTVIYDPLSLGDRSYNDLIYSGVERAAIEKGLKTYHYSPQSFGEGRQILEKTISEMASARDGVKRLLIVASESYDNIVRTNNKKLEANPNADLLYLETNKPLEGKGSTLDLPYYGALYEAGALLPAFSIHARVMGANPHSRAVSQAIAGFRAGFATTHIKSSLPILQDEKTVSVEYLSQDAGGGFSISDADALRIMYPEGEEFWNSYTLIPICGGAGGTFSRLVNLLGNYQYMGIDTAVPSAYCQVSAVKHIDRALLLCIDQWLQGGLPAHQTLGLRSGYTGVELNPIENQAKESMKKDISAAARELIHQEAIEEEEAYEN